jgi:hypothetical protein
MADTDFRTLLPGAGRITLVPRRRPWIALACAAGVFALIPLGILPLVFVMPVIGLVLAAGAPPDHVPAARPLARTRRNAGLGALLLACLAVVGLQPQLTVPLFVLFGVEQSGLVVAVLAVAALALPLAMTESPRRIDDLPVGRVIATRRNLILSATVIVGVAVWYTGTGLSYLPIAALVLGLPVLLGITRALAARRGRLEYGLWRQPLRAGLGRHRLQLAGVLLLCVLLALTLRTGAYDAETSASNRAFLIGFVAGLVALVLLALVPLSRIRLGSTLLVLAGAMFVAVQLVQVYRPATDPVTIASPLAEEWYVGQGGHAELVNYHHVGSTQSNALDIMQTIDGRTHRPGSTELTSYYIYDKPILAPAGGVVTFVLDGRPDLPIGSADPNYHAGNHIVIDIGGNRYVMMGHLRQGSIRVDVGERVSAGQPLARVGNSGNTTEPHVHIQAQSLPIGIGDVPAMSRDEVVELARTLHTYPLVFRDVVLTRDGTQTRPATADPRRGDLVRPLTPVRQP